MHRCYFIPIQLTDLSELPGRVEELRRDTGIEADTRETVGQILEDVRLNGPTALFRLTEQFDGVRLDLATFRVPPARMEAALAELRRCNPGLVADLEVMVAGIRGFALAQKASLADVDLALPGGGRARERWLPLATAGVYIPGGRAFYPSTLAMTVIPAQVAQVRRIVGVTPPKPGGPEPLVLATAALLGLEEL